MRARPHVLSQLGFGHQVARMRHQIAQQGQGLGPQGDDLRAPPQAALAAIELKRSKSKGVRWLHKISRIIT
jgi:hypothetical protein